MLSKGKRGYPSAQRKGTRAKSKIFNAIKMKAWRKIGKMGKNDFEFDRCRNNFIKCSFKIICLKCDTWLQIGKKTIRKFKKYWQNNLARVMINDDRFKIEYCDDKSSQIEKFSQTLKIIIKAKNWARAILKSNFTSKMIKLDPEQNFSNWRGPKGSMSPS